MTRGNTMKGRSALESTGGLSLLPDLEDPKTLQSAKSLGVHFSSRTDEWETPQWLFEALNVEFGFDLDPCCTKTNAKCDRFFTKHEDGLSRSWGESTVFMNPPYGRAIGRWMRKAYESARDGATVVCLIPARTDTRYWHRYAMRGEIRLLRGRLKFGVAKTGAPFPSAIVIFRPRGFQLRACDLEY